MKTLAAALVLAATSCAALRPTPEAIADRRIAGELRHCLFEADGRGPEREVCRQWSMRACREAGRSPACGVNILYEEYLERWERTARSPHGFLP